MESDTILKPSLGQITIITRRRLIESLGAAVCLAPFALAAGTPEFIETEDNQEGPYYKAGAPKRWALVDKGMPGTPFELTGRVFNTKGTPLAGAEVDVWQANDSGDYDNSGFTLRGIVIADENGVYKLQTILPKHYKTGPNSYRPAHIHFKLRAPGCKELTTQLYFKGDRYNAVDTSVRPSLILRPKDLGKSQSANFQFVLKEA
jgi:protocatechuate 3,4-dioxygenase beta subunit